MTISFSGIGSGNDWGTLIDQLVALERRPITKLQTQKSNANKQLSVVGDLLAKLGTLATRASAARTSGGLWGVAAASSDPTQVKVTSTGTGAAGSFALRVEQLARGESRRSEPFTAASPGLEGSVSIAVGGGEAVAVAYSASDSLSDIAARINAKVPGVTATALHDGTSYRLLVSSGATGATAGAMTITESGDGLGLGAEGSVTVPARDARVEVNGVMVASATNTLKDVIPGVSLDLLAPTGAAAPDVTVTLARDAGGMTQKVKDLVAGFNDAARLLHGQLSYNGVARGTDTLYGDSGAQRLSVRLGGTVAREYGGTSLARLGVTLQKDGTLALDESKLAAALAADPGKVESLLTGPDGLAEALRKVADEYASVSGPFVARQATLRATMRRADEDILRLNQRAQGVEERLRQQFTSLDRMMATYDSTLSYLNKLSSK